MKKYCLVLLLAWMGAVSAGKALVDLTPLVKTWPHLVPNAVPPVMIFDAARKAPKDMAVVKVFQMESALLEAQRGQKLCLTLQARRLQGQTDLHIVNRFWHVDAKWNLIYSQSQILNKSSANLVTHKIYFTLPEQREVNLWDFMLVMYPTPQDKTIWQITNLELSRADDAAPAAVRAQVSLTLPRDSQPLELTACSIVIPQRDNAIYRLAAQELQEHLQLMCGRKLPIVWDNQSPAGPTIQIGDTRLAQKNCLAPQYFAPDSFVVCRRGNQLFLAGGDNAAGVVNNLQPRGTLFAVYEFLERNLGVRWYWPGELGRVVPRKKKLPIGQLYYTGTPSYATRMFWYGTPPESDFSAQASQTWQNRMRWSSRGGSPIGMHSFEHWSARYGAAHPEYFALQSNGTRAHLGQGMAKGHVCFSNPEVLKTTIREKLEFFRQHPEIHYAPVMPGDAIDLFYCRCPECSKKIHNGNFSNLVWGFVNQVAAAVGKEFPNHKITCCAYSNYQQVPDFALLPNVAVTLCFSYPPHASVELKQKYRELLRAWQATGAEIYAWDYWDVLRRFRGTLGSPALFPRQIKERLMLDRGVVQGRAIELCEIDAAGKTLNQWANWGFDVLNVYVASHLMWNFDTDVEQLLAEFFPLFYGPAGATMQKFYDQMEARWTFAPYPDSSVSGWSFETCWRETYPPEFVGEMMKLLRQAVQETKKQAPYYQRVLKTLESFLPFEANSRRYSGQKAAGNAKKLRVPKTTSAPQIDGKFDDACWSKAGEISQFYENFMLKKIVNPTHVKLLHDEKNLYLAIRAEIPPDKQVRFPHPNLGARDSFLWDYESVEIFFGDPKPELYQYIIAFDGKIFDAHHPEKFGGAQWNSQLKFATRRAPDHWTAEVAIPLDEIKFKSGKKASYRFNMYRNSYTKQPGKAWYHEQGCWQAPYGSFHDVSCFGELELQ